MAAPDLIEITEEQGRRIPRIAGTRIRVSEVVMMHLRNHSSIEWILGNYEVLDHAKIYAALAYYYQHQAEMDAEMETPVDTADGVLLSDLIAKAKRNNT
ncbi:MAG: DUF433 domain-containing protein [Anaerolineae bacterium]|nr:MAG: DUF433 domain-containing protein [Anaerolineae bacterium]